MISTTGTGVRDPQDQPKYIVYLRQCPGLGDSALLDAAHTGTYRVGYVGKASGRQLSRADGADFVLKELTGNKYIQQMPVVSY
jgi:hypothetical protein